MININLILGNIFKETSLESTNFEKLAISRIDLEKRILRKKTDLGTDIGIN
jgi:urease accessory protein UreE